MRPIAILSLSFLLFGCVSNLFGGDDSPQYVRTLAYAYPPEDSLRHGVFVFATKNGSWRVRAPEGYTGAGKWYDAINRFGMRTLRGVPDSTVTKSVADDGLVLYGAILHFGDVSLVRVSLPLQPVSRVIMPDTVDYMSILDRLRSRTDLYDAVMPYSMADLGGVWYR